MDPYQNHRNQPNRDSRNNMNNDETSGNADGRRPQHSDGFTTIPPNESRRSQMTTMARKEEEELQRWKEAHRVTSVHVNPQRLGGNGSLAEAREKQFTNMRCSKLQKKLKREELEKRRRHEEEEKLQRMKAEQRQKAERLEERSRQEERRRREQLRQDHLRTTESFLQSLEGTAPGPPASRRALQTSSWDPDAEGRRRDEPASSEGDVEPEHRRANAAFLDKLEGRGGGGARVGEARLRPARPRPGPGPSGSERTEEAGEPSVAAPVNRS